MDIHFRDDRPEAVVPVMVAFDENELAIQPLFKLPVFFDSPFFPTFEDEVSQKEDRIIRLNSLVMLSDNRFIHFLNCFKGPLAIADDIEVREMII